MENSILNEVQSLSPDMSKSFCVRYGNRGMKLKLEHFQQNLSAEKKRKQKLFKAKQYLREKD